MKDEIKILCSFESKQNDSNIISLAEFLGLKCNPFQIDDQISLDHLEKHLSDGVLCLLVSSITLANVLESHAYSKDIKNILFNKTKFLFVFGFSSAKSENTVLNYLTDGLVCGVSNFRNCSYQYSISPDSEEITRQFSGTSFGPINNKNDFSFDIGIHSSNYENIISISKKPFFLKTRRNNCTLFLLSSRQIIDINKEVEINKPISAGKIFSQIIPPMMFLKYVFKNKCWHNDITYANFIIDDPLLKESYGFLNYRKLLETMDKHNFTTTISFIPFNYKRTNENIADIFQKRSDRFSLCVHGADHTQGEFGITDIGKLNGLIRKATNKMKLHEQLYGVEYDNVMVFPQGIFSTRSIEILKCNNYLAAVNSNPFSNDLVKTSALILADLLDIAIMKYNNYPLFLRRYPGEVVDFAFDAFLGKPILIVEHHEYFKDGYDKLAEFIDKINNSLTEAINWKNLTGIFNVMYMQKKVSDETVFCRLYTNKTIIKNKYDKPYTYVINKFESNEVPIEKVLLNGNSIPYRIENNDLTFSVGIASKGIIEVSIIYKNPTPGTYEKKKLGEILKIYSRRYMSEFRDRFLSKNDTILKLANKLKKMILS